MKRLITGLAMMSLLAIIPIADAHGQGWWGEGHMMGPGHGMGWGWMFLNGLFWLVIIALIVILTVWAIRRITSDTRGTQPLQEAPRYTEKKICPW